MSERELCERSIVGIGVVDHILILLAGVIELAGVRRVATEKVFGDIGFLGTGKVRHNFLERFGDTVGFRLFCSEGGAARWGKLTDRGVVERDGLSQFLIADRNLLIAVVINTGCDNNYDKCDTAIEDEILTMTRKVIDAMRDFNGELVLL